MILIKITFYLFPNFFDFLSHIDRLVGEHPKSWSIGEIWKRRNKKKHFVFKTNNNLNNFWFFSRNVVKLLRLLFIFHRRNKTYCSTSQPDLSDQRVAHTNHVSVCLCSSSTQSRRAVTHPSRGSETWSPATAAVGVSRTWRARCTRRSRLCCTPLAYRWWCDYTEKIEVKLFIDVTVSGNYEFKVNS